MKQLLENKVRVVFINPDGSILHVRWFDLAKDEERREMGKLCAQHQSATMGNVVKSEVITIKRA